MLEDKIQNQGKFLFRFSLGGDALDQRSGDGQGGGRFKIIAPNSRFFSFPELRDAGREDSICFLNKIIQNSYFKQKVSLEKQKAQKEERFHRGRQIAYMIYDYLRVTGAHESVLGCLDLFSITHRNDNVQKFDTRWDEVLLSMTKLPPGRWYKMGRSSIIYVKDSV